MGFSATKGAKECPLILEAEAYLRRGARLWLAIFMFLLVIAFVLSSSILLLCILRGERGEIAVTKTFLRNPAPDRVMVQVQDSAASAGEVIDAADAFEELGAPFSLVGEGQHETLLVAREEVVHMLIMEQQSYAGPQTLKIPERQPHMLGTSAAEVGLEAGWEPRGTEWEPRWEPGWEPGSEGFGPVEAQVSQVGRGGAERQLGLEDGREAWEKSHQRHGYKHGSKAHERDFGEGVDRREPQDDRDPAVRVLHQVEGEGEGEREGEREREREGEVDERGDVAPRHGYGRSFLRGRDGHPHHGCGHGRRRDGPGVGGVGGSRWHPRPRHFGLSDRRLHPRRQQQQQQQQHQRHHHHQHYPQQQPLYHHKQQQQQQRRQQQQQQPRLQMQRLRQPQQEQQVQQQPGQLQQLSGQWQQWQQAGRLQQVRQRQRLRQLQRPRVQLLAFVAPFAALLIITAVTGGVVLDVMLGMGGKIAFGCAAVRAVAPISRRATSFFLHPVRMILCILAVPFLLCASVGQCPGPFSSLFGIPVLVLLKDSPAPGSLSPLVIVAAHLATCVSILLALTAYVIRVRRQLAFLTSGGSVVASSKDDRGGGAGSEPGGGKEGGGDLMQHDFEANKVSSDDLEVEVDVDACDGAVVDVKAGQAGSLDTPKLDAKAHPEPLP